MARKKPKKPKKIKEKDMAITWQELRREDTKDGRRKVVVKFEDSGTVVGITNFHFTDNTQATTQITARANAKALRIPFKLNELNHLELPGIDNIRTFMVDLVTYVRNNPTCTPAQLETAIDTAYPNIPYKPGAIYDQIKVIANMDLTFDQFKTYLINNKFYEVDD